MRKLLWLGLAYWSCLAPCGVVGVFGPDVALASDAMAESTISVHLTSGRTFTAALDARTDAAELWLCFEQAGVEVLRPIRWDRVVSAEVAGQQVSGEQLHRLVEQVRQEIPAQPVAPIPMTNIVMVGQPDGGLQNLNPEPRTLNPEPDTRRVVSLAIDAGVGRWDENVDPDGIVVRIYPLDADGAIVPVRGTLNVDLKLEQRSIDLLHQPFVDAGNWSELVRPADFGPNGAVCRLRFQSIHPEFDDSVQSPGLVHACLSVPGQGTFEASTYLSFIRPFNPARDHLQSLTRHGYFPGYRYFRDERTDDGRR